MRRPRDSSQRRVWRQRVRVAGGLLLLVTACLAAFFAHPQSPEHAHASAPRQLGETHVRVHFWHTRSANTNATTQTNATNANSTSESCGHLAEWEQNGGIFLYLFLLAYLFVALAIVCDDYFVTSLEKITEAMGLSSDVAGATFMAAGSSAPELFVSLADNVFAKPQASLGIGTIVGSAIFNILIIIALSSLLAGQVLQLDWRPLLRDSLWYCWSILALTYAIWDGSVDVAESVVMFGSYIAYILYMSQNERIINACCQRPETENENDTDTAVLEAAADRAAQLVDANVDADKRAWTIDVERVESDGADDAVRLARGSSTGVDTQASQHHHHHPHRLGSQSRLNPMYRSKYRMFQYHAHSTEPTERKSESAATTETHQEELRGKHTVVGSLRPLNVETLAAAAAASRAATEAKKNQKETEVEEETEPPLGGYFDEIFDVPAGFLPKVWFVFTRPIVVAMRLTIPDARYPRFSGVAGFTASFLLSIVWIAVLSHFTVVWATKFGCLAGIPSALMGLTIIAAGTSIPDAMSSVLVARDGHGDMAVSNALGSNVFDVLLGLGLPFFLSNLVYKEPVPVDTGDLELSIFMLFGVLVMVVLLLMAAKWRLHPISGAVMAVLYAAYVVFSYVRGL